MKTNDPKIVAYKCTECGAPLNYRPGMITIPCGYCQAIVTIVPEKREEKRSSKKKVTEVFDLREGKVGYCQKCKGNFLQEDSGPEGTCPFCETKIPEQDIQDGFYVAPSHYLPFKISEERSREHMTTYLTEKYSSSLAKMVPTVAVKRIYTPYWIDDLDIYTPDGDLRNALFAYRSFFIPASHHTTIYWVDSMNVKWNRNELVPIEKESLKEGIVDLFSIQSPLSENSSDIVLHQREKNFESFSRLVLKNRKDEAKKIKKAHLVVVPMYEYRFTYKNRDYFFFQNGYVDDTYNELSIGGYSWSSGGLKTKDKSSGKSKDKNLPIICFVIILVSIIVIIWSLFQ